MVKKIFVLFLLVFVLFGCTNNKEIEPFYVTFESNGGGAVGPILIEGEVVTFPIPTKTGHTFLGWYKDVNNEKSKVVDSSSLKFNTTLFAKWKANEYTITFETNGGSKVEQITLEYGKPITAPTNPTKEGYIFKGWYTDNTFTNAYKFTTMAAENITLYAKWGKMEYTVNFYDIYGELLKTVNVFEGESVNAPIHPSVNGYTFTGWDKDLSKIKENLDVYPLYTYDEDLFPYQKISEVKKKIIESSLDKVYVEFAGEVIGFDSLGYSYVADATGSIYVRAKNSLLFLGNKVVIKGYGYIYRGSEGYKEFNIQISSDGINISHYSGNLSIPKLPEKLEASTLQDITNYQNKSFLGNLVTVTGYVQTDSSKYNFYLVDESNKVIVGIHHYSTNFNNQITDSSTNKFLKLNGVKVTITGIIYRYYDPDKSFSIQCIGYKDELVILDDIEKVNSIGIFAINDTHGAFNSDEGITGLDKVSTVINNLEEDYGELVKIANGDIFQGTYVSNVNRGKPLVEALNLMNFDVFVLGNHEFDWGIDEIARFKDGNLENGEANFPFLAANIYKKSTMQRLPWTDEYAIINKGGLKIGIIGAIGYGLESSILSSMVEEYTFLDPVPIVERLAKKLRVDENVDMVIVAIHDYDVMTNRRISNLNGDSFIDAIICGHTHQQISDEEMRADGYMIPIMQSYTKNGSVGNIVINFEDGKVKSAKITHYNPKQYSSDPIIINLIKMYQKDIDEGNRVLTYTPERLSRDKIGEEMIEAMLQKYKVDFAIINTGGVRTELNTGNIRVKDVFEVFPFDNKIILTAMSGYKLKNLFSTQGKYLYYNKVDVSLIQDSKIYNLVTIDYVYTGSYYTYHFSDSKATYDGTLMRTLFIEYLENIKSN